MTPEINFDGPISLKKLTRQAIRQLERKIILKVLQTHHWNRKQAASTLDISYRALLYKIREAGLPRTVLRGAVLRRLRLVPPPTDLLSTYQPAKGLEFPHGIQGFCLWRQFVLRMNLLK